METTCFRRDRASSLWARTLLSPLGSCITWSARSRAWLPSRSERKGEIIPTHSGAAFELRLALVGSSGKSGRFELVSSAAADTIPKQPTATARPNRRTRTRVVECIKSPKQKRRVIDLQGDHTVVLKR